MAGQEARRWVKLRFIFKLSLPLGISLEKVNKMNPNLRVINRIDIDPYLARASCEEWERERHRQRLELSFSMLCEEYRRFLGTWGKHNITIELYGPPPEWRIRIVLCPKLLRPFILTKLFIFKIKMILSPKYGKLEEDYQDHFRWKE